MYLLVLLCCVHVKTTAQYFSAAKKIPAAVTTTNRMEVGKPFSEALKFNSVTDTFETESNKGPFIGTVKNSRVKLADEVMFVAPIYFNDVAVPFFSTSLKHESNPTSMPLSLKSFQSGFENLKPALNWVAAVEDNLNYYAVQRSIDGLEFQDIAFVFPEGVKLVDSKYSFVDFEIPAGSIGVIYYRLKLKDSDGTEEFSGIKTVYLGLGERNNIGGLNFDGTVKVLSYQVRTPQRPEMEMQEDPHPWPSPDNRNSLMKIWEVYKTQVKEKVKSIWNINN